MSYPHQIIAPQIHERRTNRNCLRVDFLSDGTPEPRCNLKPRNEQAVWILENRPYHIAESAVLFDLCYGNAPSCDECPVYQRAQFRAVPVRVYGSRGLYTFEVTTLGRCTWYAIYTGHDFQDAADWVKKHGGALGRQGEDAWGRYREGFVNWYQIPEELRP